MNELDIIQKFAIWTVPVILAITVHEVAHGWVARLFGDNTAMAQGRLTLNPLKHIDPVGTILVPGIMLLLTGFVFGWAKPVPVNWRNLRSPKKDMVWVALAGPAANLLMAIFWALVLKLGVVMSPTASGLAYPMMLMGTAGILINAVVMLINLMPIPPLDGGRVMTGLLPLSAARWYAQLERYGMFIIVALLVSGVLSSVIWPLVTGFVDVLLSLTANRADLFAGLLHNLAGR